MELEIRGVERLVQRLQELDKRTAKKEVTTALRVGAKFLQKELKAAAPVETGMTKAAVRVKAMKRNRSGKFGLRVEIGEGDYKGETYYAAFVEYGFKSHGKKIKGKGWIRKTFDENKKAANDLVINTLKQRVDYEAKP